MPDNRNDRILALCLVAIAVPLLMVALPSFVDYLQSGIGDKTAKNPTYKQCGDDCPWWYYSSSWVAIFTLVLTISTIALWVYTARMAKATKDAVALTKQQFLAGFRPLLIVRYARQDICRDTGNQTVYFMVINAGPTRAIVRGGRAYLTEEKGPLPPPDLGNRGEAFIENGTVIEPGGSYPYNLSIPRDLRTDPFKAVFPPDNKSLWLMGFIVYEDEIGSRRTTAFARMFDYDIGAFVKHPEVGGDHEYQD